MYINLFVAVIGNGEDEAGAVESQGRPALRLRNNSINRPGKTPQTLLECRIVDVEKWKTSASGDMQIRVTVA
jgi:hypothetical protein